MIKESVRLRERKLSTGNISLYLDIYRNGVREYEYLKLYLIPEKTRADREKNKQTRQVAEAIKSQRTLELVNGEYGLKISSNTGNTLFYDVYESIAQTKAPKTRGIWYCTLRVIREVEPNRNFKLSSVNEKWAKKIRDYLDSKPTLGAGSKFLYWATFGTFLRQVKKRGLIQNNPIENVEGFRSHSSERMFLTLDELKQLTQTPAPSEIVRRVFLFSCLTGLRWSDVSKLTWDMVTHVGNRTRLTFTQQKTRNLEYIDISEQAVVLMGERRQGKVFDKLYTQPCINKQLKRWTSAAGIDKHISFHCARHTFAVMMLDLGTDIYTVSKLLGHRNLATTQIYAKVLDKNKQEAVDRIPSIFCADPISTDEK